MWEYDSYDNIAPWYEYKDNIKSLTLSEGIASIGNEAFRNLDKVEQPLVLPETLTHIGMYSFSNFGSDGIGALTIPGNVFLLEGAFKGNYFSEINLPQNVVTTIENEVFANSYNLTSITIPENIDGISYGAFSGSGNLTDVVVLGNVHLIDDSAFYCDNLETFTIYATTAPTLGEDVFPSSIYETATLYHHAGATDYESKGWYNYYANCYAIYSGTCGENAYWTLNVTTGELRIYGTGAMNNFGST